jgi:alpha-beta hydrolase superfamily lysophospholipase
VEQWDILGEPYEQMILNLDPDDEGDVTATLVRRRAEGPPGRAVLYLHGYVDYFFQTHLADFYVRHGYHFYALDLRKYGRSLGGHQTPNFCTDVSDYFAEIDEAVRIIREHDGHDVLLVNGHSTGALIAALWAHHVRRQGKVQALFLNSPFFDFKEPWVLRRAVAPILASVGALRPFAALPRGVGSIYGRTLHRSQDGEWDYDLTWKPLTGYPVRLGWLRAIRRAHLRLRAGLDIDVPILVACSTRSHLPRRYAEVAHIADAVLNVEHIVRWAPNLGRHVTIVRIEGGRHDLTLSRAEPRQRMFDELGRWLGAYVAGGALTEPAS